jgi:hypothetical protein
MFELGTAIENLASAYISEARPLSDADAGGFRGVLPPAIPYRLNRIF